MKLKALLITCTFLFCTPLIFAQDIKGLIDTDDFVAVRFSKGMTQVQLDALQDWAEDRGYELDYLRTKFYKDGGLKGISFSINTKDGFSGTAQKFPLEEGKPIGFYRDYREGMDAPFGTGDMWEKAAPASKTGHQ